MLPLVLIPDRAVHGNLFWKSNVCPKILAFSIVDDPILNLRPPRED